jgi:hypothetical protein
MKTAPDVEGAAVTPYALCGGLLPDRTEALGDRQLLVVTLGRVLVYAFEKSSRACLLLGDLFPAGFHVDDIVISSDGKTVAALGTEQAVPSLYLVDRELKGLPRKLDLGGLASAPLDTRVGLRFTNHDATLAWATRLGDVDAGEQELAAIDVRSDAGAKVLVPRGPLFAVENQGAIGLGTCRVGAPGMRSSSGTSSALAMLLLLLAAARRRYSIRRVE